jgi:hypothetical protein
MEVSGHFTPCKSLQHPLNRPQVILEKSKISWPWWDLNLHHPACSIVMIHTAVSQLLMYVQHRLLKYGNEMNQGGTDLHINSETFVILEINAHYFFCKVAHVAHVQTQKLDANHSNYNSHHYEAIYMA